MQEKQIEKLNKLLELVQNDTVSPKDIEKFLTMVIALFTKEREQLNNVSSENLNKISKALEYIDSSYNQTLLEIVNERKKTSKEFDSKLNEVRDLLLKLSEIKATPGKNGKDADEEYIIDSVLSKIEFPEQKKFELVGEEIVEKINELPIDEDEYKIDFEHIKGIKEYVRENAVSVNTISNSNKYIKELLDVDLSGVTYNTTTKKYELGSGGGGVQSVVAGTNITVDNTDPLNPIISSTGGSTTINNGQATTWNPSSEAVDWGGIFETDIYVNSSNDAGIHWNTTDGANQIADFSFTTSTFSKAFLSQSSWDYEFQDWNRSEVGVDDSNRNAYMSQYAYDYVTAKWETGTFKNFVDRIQANRYPETRDDTGSVSPQNWLYTDKDGNFLSAPLNRIFDYAGTIPVLSADQLFVNTQLYSYGPSNFQGALNVTGLASFYSQANFYSTTYFSATTFFSAGFGSTVTNLLNASLTNTQTGANGLSALNITQTWNTTGNPKAILLNVTNTASGATSLLMDLQVGGTTQFNVSKAGAVYIAGTLSTNNQLSIAQASDMRWNNRSRMYSDTSGTIRLMNSALTDFDRLQFGGSTSSFPSLKRSGTGLISRLADDSADAPFTASNLISTGVVRLKGYTVATLPAGTEGDTAYCTDLLTPGFLAIAVGGGANKGPVFYNGTNWVTY